MTKINEQRYADLPESMVKYFAARMTRVSRHAGGHRGRKPKGKDARRRALRARGEGVAERSAWASRAKAEREAGVTVGRLSIEDGGDLVPALLSEGGVVYESTSNEDES